MLSVTCSCGKVAHAEDSMAGLEGCCMKCGNHVVFPSRNRPVPALVGASSPAAGSLSAGLFSFDPPAGLPSLSQAAESPSQLAADAPAAPAAPAATLPTRLPCEQYYWVFLFALLPLLLILFNQETQSGKERLDRTLEKSPHLKARVEELLNSEDATPADLFAVLPGHRLDERAYLAWDSSQHYLFALWSAVGFLVIGIILAGQVTPSWTLPLVGLFTATMGIAFLLIFHDFVGEHESTLAPGQSFLTNLLGFVFIVGLGEELSKALPVLFYVRTFRNATWRGACLWGLASGIGFGIAEGIHYSVGSYNGVAGPETYLVRFISCVALHGLWSASVGVTIFHSRQLVNRLLGMLMYEGNWRWSELAGPILRVLGIAMVLHGLYDTLLTQDLIPLALLVALVSFVWLGWQIETSREKEMAALAAAPC